MARYHDARRTYEGTERFVDVALRRDDSLFTPGRAIWTAQSLGEIDQRFIQKEDGRAGVSFEEKLRAQLEGASADVYQLMGEILYFYYLEARYNITGPTKRAKIGEILSWSPSPVAIPPELDAILDDGVASGGPAYSNRKPGILRQYILYMEAWKRLDQEAQDEALSDAWAFKRFLRTVPVEQGAFYARESLLHAVHPDTFERILSRSEKGRLIEALKDVAPPDQDIDRRLLGLREIIGARVGMDFDWYDTIPACALWHKFDDPWVGYVFWAGRFRNNSTFDQDERKYKLTIAEHMGEARAAVLADADDWVAKLKRAYGHPNNITSFHAHGIFLRWVEAHPDVARDLLTTLWDGEGEPLGRYETFLASVPKEVLKGRGTRLNVLGLLLLAIDPYGLPPFKTTALERSYSLTGFGVPPPDQSEAETYRHSIAFFDALLERARTAGLELRDRLDAQGVMWCIGTYDEPQGQWPPEEWTAFVRWRGGEPISLDEDEDDEEQDEDSEGHGKDGDHDALPALAAQLLLDEGHLREIEDLLERKRQVVFYGPPGTGKTYVARELAWALAGDKERVRLVQFHPSYAYEDFVEGYRPRSGGEPGFELRDGPFKALAAAALADRAHVYYLIIDEMNRGNVAKVLGELYFLLEYRDERIQLQYSSSPFELPPNLRIIGTMNTADRSIALLDAALRRRFTFVPFFPDRPPVEGLLGRWLRANRPEMAWVADVIDRANERLADRNGAIGPSFFLKADLDEARLERIWRHEISPYLEDHFLDEPERLQEFELKVLRSAPGLSKSDVPVDETASGQAGEDDAGAS